MENYELGGGIYCFAPMRSKRWLKKGFKSDLCTIEELQIQVSMAVNKDNPNFENNPENGIFEIEEFVKEQIKNIELLSLMTKQVPEWVDDTGDYVGCNASFLCKLFLSGHGNKHVIQVRTALIFLLCKQERVGNANLTRK